MSDDWSELGTEAASGRKDGWGDLVGGGVVEGGVKEWLWRRREGDLRAEGWGRG